MYINMVVFIIFITWPIELIRTCGIGNVKPPKPPGWKPPARDWDHWLPPPYNVDWIGFVNKLGSRDVPMSTTEGEPDIDYENEDGWPSNWRDMGFGYKGANPPKWAELNGGPVNLPICLEPSNKGHCEEHHIRWFYDAKLGECRTFVYTGCNGTENRFISHKRCSEVCIEPPKPYCGLNRLINFKHYIHSPDPDIKTRVTWPKKL